VVFQADLEKKGSGKRKGLICPTVPGSTSSLLLKSREKKLIVRIEVQEKKGLHRFSFDSSSADATTGRRRRGTQPTSRSAGREVGDITNSTLIPLVRRVKDTMLECEPKIDQKISESRRREGEAGHEEESGTGDRGEWIRRREREKVCKKDVCRRKLNCRTRSDWEEEASSS
jgi:hypothetical protein